MAFLAPVVAQAQEQGKQVDEVVVTGSRIPRTDTTTAAPIAVVDQSVLAEHGFNNVGEMLNQVSSNVPQFPEAQASGFPAGAGQTYPNLFNLGTGRTLTLVDGRRMVTSASGLDGNAVDVNIIPSGLIDKVEIVQGGGAAVYGSDAIAGVVNYILKKNFQGAVFDAQYGEDYRGGYQEPSLRATVGRNFDSDRGNIAADFGFSKTSPLLEYERIFTGQSIRSVPNPLNKTTSDGIPPTMYVYGGRAWRFNENGIIFSSNTTSPTGLLQVNNSPVQFATDGLSIIPYNTGAIVTGQSTAVGGQGYDFRNFSTLLAGVTRYTGNVIGHYDLTDHLKVSGSFLYAHTEGRDPFGTEYGFQGVGNGSPFGPVSFTKANPYLTAGEIATLSAANPAFAAGSPLVLSKAFQFLPNRAGPTKTDTGRGLLALDGDFRAIDRDFTYSVSFSHGETYQSYRVPESYTAHFANATNAVMNSAGQIVCAINAVTVFDAGCAPLNIFANGVETAATQKYITVMGGSDIFDTQDDFLATLGGDVVKLPGGEVRFSLAYEHRAEYAKFSPTPADQAGLSSGTSFATNGSYSTNEYSGELLVPIVGGDFTLPLVHALEFTGSYRIVDNSLAGRENVWGAGLRWEVDYGLTLRGSISRNFSAPTLDELLAPRTVNPGNPAADPCDVTNINSGSNPAVRLANCKALFAAHPEYGSLATFNDPAVNTGIVAITTGGNPGLKNELSKTETYGLVFQPKYIPGLTITLDHINIALTNAISNFSANNFLATCFDSSPQPADICSTITRNAQGYLSTAVSETFNAGSLNYHGDILNADYNFPIGRFFGGRELGSLDLAADITRNAYFETSVTGFDHTRTDGTTLEPKWRERYDVRYAIGPLRLFYSLYYLPASKNGAINASIETTPVPAVKANYEHTISMQYDFKQFTFRAGVDDLTNAQPSFPSRSYGDILGRRYFAGVKARF